METHASVLRRALGWCGNLAGWFPMLRPGPKALSLAEDIAVGLGPNDGMVLPVHVQAVRALIDDRERQRLVDLFVAEQADEWVAVCSDTRASALLVKAYRLAEQDPALAWEVAENLLGVYVVERASYSSPGN